MTDRAMTDRDVSVVIAAHEAAHTVNAALASIAGQTTAPQAVILVDDGSTDATTDVASRWAGRLPLRVERLPENQGVGAARAAAMRLVTTPLVASIDADDAWLPDHLSVMLTAFEPGLLVVARDLLWSPGAWVRDNPRSLPPRHRQLEALVRGTLGSAGVLFERAACERVGGYRPTLRRSEDWDLYLRMARVGTELVLASEVTLLYRISGGSLSAGYATAAADVTVLEHALDEAASAEERWWVADSLRRRRARRALAGALDAARDGRPADARRQARAALRDGDAKTRSIAAGLVAAPAAATAFRDRISRRRWSPDLSR
jgi:GT2 family glycosyltransferase